MPSLPLVFPFDAQSPCVSCETASQATPEKHALLFYLYSMFTYIPCFTSMFHLHSTNHLFHLYSTNHPSFQSPASQIPFVDIAGFENATTGMSPQRAEAFGTVFFQVLQEMIPALQTLRDSVTNNQA